MKLALIHTSCFVRVNFAACPDRDSMIVKKEILVQSNEFVPSGTLCFVSGFQVTPESYRTGGTWFYVERSVIKPVEK